MKQGEATVNAILAVLKDKGIDYELGGEVPVKKYYDQFRTEVCKIIFEGFKADKIDMSPDAKRKYADDTKLKSYVGGLVNNWATKHPPFNGGVKYEPKSPGIRTGNKDEQVVALKALLKTVTDPEVRAEIEAALQERLAEIKPETKIEIKVEALPEQFRHLVK